MIDAILDTFSGIVLLRKLLCNIGEDGVPGVIPVEVKSNGMSLITAEETRHEYMNNEFCIKVKFVVE